MGNVRKDSDVPAVQSLRHHWTEPPASVAVLESIVPLDHLQSKTVIRELTIPMKGLAHVKNAPQDSNVELPQSLPLMAPLLNVMLVNTVPRGQLLLKIVRLGLTAPTLTCKNLKNAEVATEASFVTQWVKLALLEIVMTGTSVLEVPTLLHPPMAIFHSLLPRMEPVPSVTCVLPAL